VKPLNPLTASFFDMKIKKIKFIDKYYQFFYLQFFKHMNKELKILVKNSQLEKKGM